MLFHQRLARLRAEKGITQEELAEAAGVSRQSVAKWESGKAQPDVEKLLLLSGYFGLSLDRLVRESEYAWLPTAGPSHDTILSFLLRAKKATYAAGQGQAAASRPGSHDYRYEEESLLYLDTYLGSEFFAGEEAVWAGNVPMWAMNYYGQTTSSDFSGDFLKEALSHAGPEAPFRGPELFRRGEFTYHCAWQGDFSRFHGRELIFAGNRRVYECRFHGGAIR